MNTRITLEKSKIKCKAVAALLVLGGLFSSPVLSEEEQNKAKEGGDIPTILPVNSTLMGGQGILSLKFIYDELVPDKVTGIDAFLGVDKLALGDKSAEGIQYILESYESLPLYVLGDQKSLYEFDVFSGGEFYISTQSPGSVDKEKGNISEVKVSGSIKAELVKQDMIKVSVPKEGFSVGEISFLLTEELGDTSAKTFRFLRSDSTYVEVVPTPLAATIIEGSASSVTRGFGQEVLLDQRELSVDPDYPDNKNFSIIWWCRNLDQEMENFYKGEEGEIIIYNNQAPPEPSVEIRNGSQGGGCYGERAEALLISPSGSDIQAEDPVMEYSWSIADDGASAIGESKN